MIEKRGLGILSVIILIVSLLQFINFVSAVIDDPSDPDVLLYVNANNGLYDQSSYHRTITNTGVKNINVTFTSTTMEFNENTQYPVTTQTNETVFSFNGSNFFNVSMLVSLPKTQDFTLEMRVYRNSTFGGGGVASYRQLLFRGATSSIYHDFTNGVYGTDSLQVVLASNSIVLQCGPNCLPRYSWHTITITRLGSTAYLFIDGVLKAKDTSANSVDIANIGKDLFGKIGAYDVGNNAYNWNGYMTEISLKKGADTQLLGDLQVYFPFDGNVSDVTGNIKAGNYTSYNVKGKLNYSAGLVGQAVNLDGKGDYIYFLNTPIQYYSKSSTMFWVKSSDSDSTNDILLSQYNGADITAVDNYILTINSSNVNIVKTGSKRILAGNKPQENNWIHVAIIDTGYKLKYYLNGIEQPNLVPNYTSLVGTKVHYIGMYRTQHFYRYSDLSWIYYFNGSLDEFKVYNRDLTNTEIKNEYCKGKPLDEICAQQDIDFVPPTPSDGALDILNPVIINITAAKPLTSCILKFNTTNYNMNVNSKNALYNLPNLNVSLYYYNVTCDGLTTETRNFTVIPVEIVPVGISNLTFANWTNMNGKVITKADLNDTVKLSMGGSNLEGMTINYTVYKQETSSFLWIWSKTKSVAIDSVSTSDLYINKKMDVPGTYIFNISLIDGDGKIKTSLISSTLEVSDRVNNAFPVISVKSPACGENFTLGQTINFNLNLSDEDDVVNGGLYLDNQNIVSITNEETHLPSYTLNDVQIPGNVQIKINVSENISDGRLFSTQNFNNIIVVNTSMDARYIAACIVKPTGGSNWQGNVEFNASTTKALNYTVLSDSLEIINNSNLLFNWTIFKIESSGPTVNRNFTGTGLYYRTDNFIMGDYILNLEVKFL